MAFTREVRSGWNEYFGSQIFNDGERLGMGAEDFGSLQQTLISPACILRLVAPQSRHLKPRPMVAPIPSHHSPLFKIEPEGSVTLGVEASVSALLNVMAP